jgi:phosphoribosylformimino-5-aminoimidazole carboxamide ribonucleotide (ProFAR) isomerase
LADPLIGEIFRDFREKVVVGIDASDGMVAVQGWSKTTETPALQFAQQMEKLGAKRIVFTDISRDGMLEGVNTAAVESIIKSVGIPVIAAGGVTSVQDILDLSAIGAEGAILGKALYENVLLLPDAIAAAQGAGAVGPAHFAPAPGLAPAAPVAPAGPTQPAQPAVATVAKPYLPWMTNPPKR